METIYETFHLVSNVCTCIVIIFLVNAPHSVPPSTINYSKDLPLAQGIKFE